MAIFHVDLSLPITFPQLGTGALNNPFDALQFVQHTNSGAVVDNTYRLWGYRDISYDWLFNFGNVQLNLPALNKITITSWDREFVAITQPLHSPWRLRCRDLQLNRCPSIDGGILETTYSCIISSDAPGNVAKTMFFHVAGGILKADTFKGCTFLSSGNGRLYVDHALSIQDSIIDCVLELHVNGNLISISNSVTTYNDEFGQLSGFGPNNQFNWWSHGFPAWDEGVTSFPAIADTSVWRASELGAGINVKGSGTYTGYSTGLFGEPRLGVGACFFNEINQSSMSWVYSSDYSGTPTHLRKKYRQTGKGNFPSQITVPPTALTATRAMKDDVRDISNSEYTVNLAGS